MSVLYFSPPAEVLDDLAAAADRAESLAEDGCEVAFDHHAVTGRLVIELRTLDGGLIEALRPSQALELLCP